MQLIDFDLAIKLNPSNPNNYLNRAFDYYKPDCIEEAKQDVRIAEMLDAAIDPSFK